MAYGWEQTDKNIVELIEFSINHSKFKTADFSTINHIDKYPTNEQEVNDFIKNRIKLYFDTWVTSPLIEALRRINGI